MRPCRIGDHRFVCCHKEIVMRLVDDRSRILGLINPIDALVALVVIVVLAGVGMALFGTPGEPAVETATIEYDLLVPRVEAFDPDAIAEGDVVNELTGGELGVVVSVREEPASLDVLEEGGLVWYESTAISNVLIRVRSEATVTEQGYAVRGILVRENAVTNIWTTGFQARAAYVTDIEAVR